MGYIVDEAQLKLRRFSMTLCRAALPLLLVSLFGSPASAYVRTTSDRSNTPVFWPVSCVYVSGEARGSQDIPLPTIDATLKRAVNNWTSRDSSCGYLRLIAQPSIKPTDVAIDGHETVVFRDQEWARPGASMPHDPSAIGLTTVFYVDTPGLPGDATILDADIELNGVNYTFTTDPANAVKRPGTTSIADLENTLTHELGHVQGFAHTCWDHLTATPPLDNTGQPIPDCNGALPASITNTTMFPYANSPGETSKRTLSDDEVKAICDIYPNSQQAPACFGEIDGGACWLFG
jgi:hypothetical protein